MVQQPTTINQGESGTVKKPGKTTIKQFDIDRIPEVNITQSDLYNTERDSTSWLTYGGGYRNQRHTTADLIDQTNVGRVDLEYRIELASIGHNFQGSPLIVPGDPPIMYQTNGPDQTRAIDARTGDVLWQHVYDARASLYAIPASRGTAVLGDTLFKCTLDFGLLALDRYTGEEKWYSNGAKRYRGKTAKDGYDRELLFPRNLGEASSYPPIVYEGTVLRGSFGGEWGVSGFVDGVSTDGSLKWRFSTTPQEEWVGDSWKHGGGTVWQAPAVNPETGTAILPTANPGPWYGTVRPGWNPYTAGKVAVDINSGDYKWHYQESPHDWWDYDSPSPAVLFDAEVDNQARTLATWAGKTGWVFTADAENGRLYERSEEFVQHYNMWSLPQHTMKQTPWIMPSLDGGTDPQTSAYGPETNTLVVKGTNAPMKLAWESVEYEAGKRYLGMEYNVGDLKPEQVPVWNQQQGSITGLDPVSGDVKWRDWRSLAPWGGAVSTATKLTFAGTAEGEFIAYKTDTGEKLWRYDLGPGIDGDPICWYDPGTQKQYLAVTAGGSADVQSGGKNGNTLAVFSLKE